MMNLRSKLEKNGHEMGWKRAKVSSVKKIAKFFFSKFTVNLIEILIWWGRRESWSSFVI